MSVQTASQNGSTIASMSQVSEDTESWMSKTSSWMVQGGARIMSSFGAELTASAAVGASDSTRQPA